MTYDADEMKWEQGVGSSAGECPFFTRDGQELRWCKHRASDTHVHAIGGRPRWMTERCSACGSPPGTVGLVAHNAQEYVSMQCPSCLDRNAALAEASSAPVINLFCHWCGAPHEDVGQWASIPHHKHCCHACGKIFRVEPFCYGAPANCARCTLPLGMHTAKLTRCQFASAREMRVDEAELQQLREQCSKAAAAWQERKDIHLRQGVTSEWPDEIGARRAVYDGATKMVRRQLAKMGRV